MPETQKCLYCYADLTTEGRKGAQCPHCGGPLRSESRERATEAAILRQAAVRDALAASGEKPSDDAHVNARLLDRAEPRRAAPAAATKPEPKKEGANAVSP